MPDEQDTRGPALRHPAVRRARLARGQPRPPRRDDHLGQGYGGHDGQGSSSAASPQVGASLDHCGGQLVDRGGLAEDSAAPGPSTATGAEYRGHADRGGRAEDRSPVSWRR